MLIEILLTKNEENEQRENGLEQTMVLLLSLANVPCIIFLF